MRGVTDPEAHSQAEIRELAGRVVLDINRYDWDPGKLEEVRAEVAARIERLGQ